MSKFLDYTDRIRTLEEVAQLLKASLGIRMLKGRSDLWQVKLEKVEILNSKSLSSNYAFVRHSNPNAALSILSLRLSFADVRVNNIEYRLGRVKRGPLYIRLYEVGNLE